MKTITQKINLYSFDELSEDVQEKVIEKRQQSEEFPFLFEDMNERLFELLEQYKIEGEAKLCYSLSYCQGDGVVFIGTFQWEGRQVDIQHQGRYYHSNSKRYDIETPTGKDASENVYERFEAIYQIICKKLENWGYGIIEGTLDPDVIKNNFKESDTEFENDGTIHY